MGMFKLLAKPNGTVAELWDWVMDLVPDIERAFGTTINGVTVGTSETAVAHGQKYIPKIGIPVSRTNVAVWQSKQPDERCCYFTAASNVVIDVKVFR